MAETALRTIFDAGRQMYKSFVTMKENSIRGTALANRIMTLLTFMRAAEEATAGDSTTTSFVNCQKIIGDAKATLNAAREFVDALVEADTHGSNFLVKKLTPIITVARRMYSATDVEAELDAFDAKLAGHIADFSAFHIVASTTQLKAMIARIEAVVTPAQLEQQELMLSMQNAALRSAGELGCLRAQVDAARSAIEEHTGTVTTASDALRNDLQGASAAIRAGITSLKEEQGETESRVAARLQEIQGDVSAQLAGTADAAAVLRVLTDQHSALHGVIDTLMQRFTVWEARMDTIQESVAAAMNNATTPASVCAGPTPTAAVAVVTPARQISLRIPARPRAAHHAQTAVRRAAALEANIRSLSDEDLVTLLAKETVPRRAAAACRELRVRAESKQGFEHQREAAISALFTVVRAHSSATTAADTPAAGGAGVAAGAGAAGGGTAATTADLLDAACGAIPHLLNSQPKKGAVEPDLGGSTQGVDVALVLLTRATGERHVRNELYAYSALGVVSSMLYRCTDTAKPSLTSQFVRSGVIAPMVSILTTFHDDADVLAQCCFALSVLLGSDLSDGAVRKELVASNGGPCLMKALRRHTDNDGAVEHVCSVIHYITAARSNIDALVGKDGVALFLDTLYRHANNAAVVAPLCSTLCNVVENSAFGLQSIAGALPLLTWVYEHYVEVDEVKTPCERLIQQLQQQQQNYNRDSTDASHVVVKVPRPGALQDPVLVTESPSTTRPRDGWSWAVSPAEIKESGALYVKVGGSSDTVSLPEVLQCPPLITHDDFASALCLRDADLFTLADVNCDGKLSLVEFVLLLHAAKALNGCEDAALPPPPTVQEVSSIEAAVATYNMTASRDTEGNVKLHSFSSMSTPNAPVLIRKLLNTHVNPNVENNAGVRPLHIAASRSTAEVVSLLIGAGAEVNAVDRVGRTPLDWALGDGGSSSSPDAVIKVLTDAGCKAPQAERRRAAAAATEAPKAPPPAPAPTPAPITVPPVPAPAPSTAPTLATGLPAARPPTPTLTGKCEAVLGGHEGSVQALAALPNGLLVSDSDDGLFRIWDTGTTSIVSAFKSDTHKSFRSLAVLSEGTQIASCADKNSVKIWGVSRGECVTTLSSSAQSGPLYCVSAHSDGRVISGGAGDFIVRLWDVRSGKCVQNLAGHTNQVYAVASLSEHRIASSGLDNSVRIWDMRSGVSIQALTGHTSYVRSLVVLPDHRLVSSSNDKSLRIWDSRSGALIKEATGHSGCVFDVTARADGHFASASYDGSVKVWDANGVCAHTLSGHTGNVMSVITLSNGYFTSGGGDKTVRIWK